MVALAAVAALSCVGADVVCAQTSSRDVRVASGQSICRGETRMASGMGGEFRVGEDGLERVEQDGAGDGGLGGYSVGG